MTGSKRLSCLLTATLLVVAHPAAAAPASIPHGTVELVAESASLQPGRDFYAGLRFVLEKGWHIYWINPGDAGEPPRVTWRLPPEIKAGALEWPYPQPLAAFSLRDYGYEGEVLLPVPMKSTAALKPGSSAVLNADLRLIVCQDVCIPGKAQVSMSLPVKAEAPAASGSKPLFDAAKAKLPRTPPASWKFRVNNEKDSLRLVATLGRPVSKAFFFPLEEGQIENAAPQVVQPSNVGFQLSLKKSNQLTKPIGALRGVLQIGDKAYLVHAPAK